MPGRHARPGPLHPPDREGVAQSLVGQVVTSSQLGVHLVALQNLVQEVYVTRRQLEGLDFAQFVGWQRGDDLSQRGKRLVERLCPLALPDVGNDPLGMGVLEGWETSGTVSRNRRQGRAGGGGRVLRASFEPLWTRRGVDLKTVAVFDLVVHWRGRGHRGEVILCVGAHLTFASSEPRGCYDNGTGVRKRFPRLPFTDSHPFFRVLIARCLLLSHALPQYPLFLQTVPKSSKRVQNLSVCSPLSSTWGTFPCSARPQKSTLLYFSLVWSSAPPRLFFPIQRSACCIQTTRRSPQVWVLHPHDWKIHSGLCKRTHTVVFFLYFCSLLLLKSMWKSSYMDPTF